MPFTNFKLKVDINLFLLTSDYLDYFRKFKYNEYLRKYNLKSFLIIPPSKDSFLFNFIQQKFLIYFSSNSNFENLAFSFEHSFLNFNIFFNGGLFNFKVALFFFKLLKRYLRIYFLISSYNLYFHFKSLMRSYSSYRMFSLSSVPNSNAIWRINTFTLFYKYIYLEFFLKNHMNLAIRFPVFFCLDSMIINPTRQFFFLDYFSICIIIFILFLNLKILNIEWIFYDVKLLLFFLEL